MINPKYYSDIKKFHKQFAEGKELAKDLFISGEFNRIIVCGMGGSSLYVELLNDFLAEDEDIKLRIEANRGYSLPNNCDEKTLFIVASYSGNTEETLTNLEEIQQKRFSYVVFCSGGKLLERARKADVSIYLIPEGTQPRLSTGYFIAGVLSLLENCGLVSGKLEEAIKAASKISSGLEEEKTKSLAKSLFGKVPVIYTTSENSSFGRIAKIKFNENVKIQAFHNYFPELNHNEMVGFTNLVMTPYFLILESKFCNSQNKKRIVAFSELMKEKNLAVEVLRMPGESIFAEILNAYYFIDHLTYYLAEEYGIDPEPVEMVEEFKRKIAE